MCMIRYIFITLKSFIKNEFLKRHAGYATSSDYA